MAVPRVVLVTPLTPLTTRAIEPNIGVLTLAAILRPRWETAVVEVNAIWNEVDRRPDEFREAVFRAVAATGSDVVGFSSICGTYPTTVRLAEVVKQRMPTARIVFGGPHASVVDVQTLAAFPFVDAVIRGEAEQSFPEWIEAISAGSPLHHVAGLTYRGPFGVQRNGDPPVLSDLDLVPFPAFDMHPGVERLEVLPLELGRGCPYGCTFCSTNDFFRRRFRLKSPAVVLSQMKIAHFKYGVRCFDLVHDMFTVDRRRVVDFCNELIRSGCGFTWSCSARTDRVDRELLVLMRDAGCRGIFFGIETGSQRMQGVVDKGLDLVHARETLELCSSLGIQNTASFIAGYPEETLEDLRDTVRFLTRVSRLPSVETQIHIMSPLPRTPLTKQYWDQIYFDEGGLDDAESGVMQDDEDRKLIAAHKEIFPNFWSFPSLTDRHFIRRAANFFTYGWLKCSGLMNALHQHCGDMLEVFRLWDRTHSDKEPAYFEAWDFALDLMAFVEAEFGADRDPALMVTARFYRALRDCMEEERAKVESSAEARLTLAPSVRVVTVQGDILRVLECLRNDRRPEVACLEKPSTVVVRRRGFEQYELMELPEISRAVLQHAQRGSVISHVLEDFEQRQIGFAPLTPSEVAKVAIDKLEADRLIRRVPPLTETAAAFQALTSA
jgi:radical SAM superfamily enzyme YgiQ (UPF0313 family)